MSKITVVIFIFLLSQGLYAQKEANIWYFGDHAGLDFNSGTPVPLLDGQLNTMEGVASIADADGNLLFYTDGVTVYNKSHAVMENGTGLFGSDSSSQSAVIVPKPLSAAIYYIFTVAQQGNAGGFCYSEVNMEEGGGLGAVTNKNVPLLPQTSEQLTAVAHANGESIWVIAHGYANNKFHSFLITTAGVNLNQVTSSAGLTLSEISVYGCMKASPDGLKLGACHTTNGIQLLDFNNETGIISGAIILSNETTSYGIEFSPSGKAMYITNSHVIQYDLAAPDISASATIVLDQGSGSLQLGPDGKIYNVKPGFQHLAVIHNPDVIGSGCNAEADALYLGGPISYMGLPNFIQSFFASGIIARYLCLGDTTEFSILFNDVPDSITWDFGDGTTGNGLTTSHIYTSPGTYTVKAAVIKGNLKTLEKKITILPLPLAHKPEDMMVCDDGTGHASFNLSLQNNAILGTQDPDDFNVTYHLSQEAANDNTGNLPSNYTNSTNPQLIYARVTSSEGCYVTTSFKLMFITKPVINMDDEFAFCEGSTVTLTASAGFDGYLWSTGAVTRSITVNETGIYTITVFKETNNVTCQAVKTITVTKSVKPTIMHIEINDWTDNDNSINIIVEGGSDNEYSIDGIHYQGSPVFDGLTPGRYTVYVMDKNGCGTDKEIVVLLNYPKFFTPNGDGENETWNIKYAYFEPNMIVHVFDRYGKLVNSFRGSEPGWNGQLNGHNLPSTDYWFIVKRQNGKEHKGHFSMIR